MVRGSLLDSLLNYPFDPHVLLSKKKAIRRELASREMAVEKKIAILGGSTTHEVKEMLELFLLKAGIRPVFYESGYNRFYEEGAFPSNELRTFEPDIVYIHTTVRNIAQFPNIGANLESVESLLLSEQARFTKVWDGLGGLGDCVIIQNNFELPVYRLLGNRDCWDVSGNIRFVAQLNAYFSSMAVQRSAFYIHDINYLAAWFGLRNWHDQSIWHAYKYALNMEAIPYLAHSVASMIQSILGLSKKCLILDLDNTIWGGVIGDEGAQGIRLGNDNPEGESFLYFQKYVTQLKQRGILLGVCSKNSVDSAREGLAHPDSLLGPQDFHAFYANWDLKSSNLTQAAAALNIGLDSLVFVDDNPVEREAVRMELPAVAVPEVGAEVTRYAQMLAASGLFESVILSTDDIDRSNYYKENELRHTARSGHENHEAFLASLNMVAEFASFSPIYLDRIAQLTNKTNQFNLTVKRFSRADLDGMSNDPACLTLHCRLKDRFGDNGIVSVVAGKLLQDTLHISLWLMSCRVFQRGLEYAVFDVLVHRAVARGVNKLVGHYCPAPKNNMVREFYGDLGFQRVSEEADGSAMWVYEIPANYNNRNILIEVVT